MLSARVTTLDADALFEVASIGADHNKRNIRHAHAGNAHKRTRPMSGRVDKADPLVVPVQAPQLGQDCVQALPLIFGLVRYPREASHGLPGNIGCSFYRLERVVSHRIGELEHGTYNR